MTHLSNEYTSYRFLHRLYLITIFLNYYMSFTVPDLLNLTVHNLHRLVFLQLVYSFFHFSVCEKAFQKEPADNLINYLRGLRENLLNTELCLNVFDQKFSLN